MQLSYRKFADKNDARGPLLVKKGIPLDTKGLKPRIFTYSLYEGADFHAENIRLSGGHYIFDLKGPNISIKEISLAHPGMVNFETL